jgi:hypothetical protein
VGEEIEEKSFTDTIIGIIHFANCAFVLAVKEEDKKFRLDARFTIFFLLSR